MAFGFFCSISLRSLGAMPDLIDAQSAILFGGGRLLAHAAKWEHQYQ